MNEHAVISPKVNRVEVNKRVVSCFPFILYFPSHYLIPETIPLNEFK